MRTVHKVCTMLKRWEAADRGTAEAEPCALCPCWDRHEHYGPTKALCRGKAEEFVNIVKTGNPWGVKGRKWPKTESSVKEHGK